MTECRHGLSEDCPGCMQEAIDAAFATCIMIVEEECGLDKKPAQGRDNYVHGKYDVGMSIVDRIKCAQRNPDETKMRVPAQGAPVTDAMVERAWAAIVGRDIALQCFNASIIRADLRTGLEAAFTSTECGETR